MKALLAALALLALALGAEAGSTMLDYRIRGYMELRSTTGGSNCSDTFLVACAAQGRLGLRASTQNLKVLPPSTGFAVFRGKIIDCPEGVAAIDNVGGTPQAVDGLFPADTVSPSLVPATAFVMVPGGSGSALQIRTLGTFQQCIYNFELVQATNYILGVQPVQWISIFGAAGERAALSPALLLASSLAALAALFLLRT